MSRPVISTTWPDAPTSADWDALEAAIHARCRGTQFGVLACWEWQGPRQSRGYGVVDVRIAGMRHTLTHRLIVACHLRQPLARWQYAIHSCNNRRCCNPAHLRPGTAKENYADMAAAGRAFRPPGNRRQQAARAARQGVAA